jgi:hypothetical protein
MKCLAAACALLFTVGCATEEARQQFNEAMKDARGENMEMRNSFATPAPKAQKSSLPDQ